MPSSFLRGLDLFETLDVHGPLTVTEIARLMGHDKSWVSRMVSSCETGGWVERQNGRVALGPRAALLAYASGSGQMIRLAQPLVEAVAGVTGLAAQAYALVGSRATVIAAAGGLGVGMSTSLVATAAGRVIAAQLEPERLERLLPEEPFPEPLAELLANPGFRAFAAGRLAPESAVSSAAPSVPQNRSEFDARLQLVKQRGYGIDNGDLHPQIGCIAVPWLGASGTAALACMAAPAEIAATAELVHRVLRAAAAPAATRDEIVAAAAAGRHYSVAP